MSVSAEEVIVETSQGELLGATSTTADGTHYFTFRGVPYAKPPVGPLRFKELLQILYGAKGEKNHHIPPVWDLNPDTVIDDTLALVKLCSYLNLTPGVVQGNGAYCVVLAVPAGARALGGAEGRSRVRDTLSAGGRRVGGLSVSQRLHATGNCHHSVTTTQLGPNSNLPVMVWFYWGAFAFGSADLNPGHLMDLGVVVVSVQYRLNVFGFLSLEGTDVPGNAGLKDQAAALRWINKNINQFGGDENRVTLFGCSAGGSSVHFHVLSRLSTGLFHRGISQSGTGTDPWAYIDQSQPYAFRLGRNLGLQTEDPQELLDLLRSVPADELEAAVVELLEPDEKTRYYTFPFLPSLEHPSGAEEPFLAQHPDYIEHHGNFNKVVVLYREEHSSHFTLLSLDRGEHNREEHQFTLLSLDRGTQFTLHTAVTRQRGTQFTLHTAVTRQRGTQFTLLSLDRGTQFTLDREVPYITGVNNMEGKFSIVSDPKNNDVTQPSYWETINSDLERVVPVNLGLEKGSPESLRVANKVKEFYFGDRNISLETKEQWIQLQSDILFNVKTQFTVRRFADRSNSTYNYHFTYNDSAHTQEMDYLFYQNKVSGESSKDTKIANVIGTLWANFAKTGVPSFQGGVKWEPVSKSRLYYLKIDDELSLEEELEKERIDFWLDIYNSHQKMGLAFSPVAGRLDGEL
uniref:Carboxylic ester hydrolase n=1 Tax=Timema douglasi TaxID=61478 RepID=A0A7R8Z9X0_TIMDO|nr:unnamed protein product [Timema douglasi]